MTIGVYARLEARPGKEAELKSFLETAVELSKSEPGTLSWMALQLGPSTFAIFDTYGSEADLAVHMEGEIAKAFGAKAADLLAAEPKVDRFDVMAAK